MWSYCEANPNVRKCWVCDSSDGFLEGFIIINANEIEILVVSESCRRRGVARKLILSAESYVRSLPDHSHRHLHLVVTAAQPAALAFYKSMGYTITQSSKLTIFGDQTFKMSQFW